MKTPIPILFSIALLAVSPAIAQETAGVDPATDQPVDTVTEAEMNANLPDGIADAALANRTFIPHALKVQPFSPPPPPVVKRLPAVRVDSAVTHLSKNARTLTLQRGAPSTQPDLPPPPPPPPYVEPHEPTPEEIAQRIWQHRHNLNLGATVYDHKISVVNWTDQVSLVHYEAVCGFDLGLLAGVGNFVHKGKNYSLFFMHSDFDTTMVRRFASKWPLNQWLLKIPEVAPGDILITRGDVNDTAATAPMTVLKEIIAEETPRLLPYQAARTTYQAAYAAWNAAHPPIPRDETFILRPHRGSRYLPGTKTTQPAQP